METSSIAPLNSTSGSETFVKCLRKFDGLMYLAASFLGIAGNTMVFIAFAISKKLQTKTNIFVVNLAFADFLTSLLLPIFAWSLITDIDVVHPWINALCALSIGFAQFSVGCSLITLAFIALNRLILITQNRKNYEIIYSTQNCVCLVAIAWLVPIVTDVTPLVFGIGELGFDQQAHICGAKSDNPYAYVYDVIIVGSFIPIPMLIIVYSYARIFRHIAIHNKQLNASQNTSNDLQARTVSGRFNGNTSTRLNAERLRLKKQIEISKNLFYVIVAFIIFVAPHFIAEILNSKPVVINQTKTLVIFNSVINPVLYGLKHPHFRQVFKCILCRRWKEVPQPSWILKSSGCPIAGNNTESHDMQFI